MGVAGLLPALRSVMDQVHVSKYAGKTAGVDASGWLYKGAYSCAADVVLGRDTDVYLNYCVQQVKMLQQNGVTPVLVFDGAPLPAKDKLNEARNRNRAIWRNKARRLLEEGGELSGEAASAANRALAVSNDMIMRLIGVLRRMGVAFYVAPYEADAQLAFLSKAKLIDVVISEDSDCIPYGCKTILFKLSPDGWGSELKRRSLGANEELSFLGWSEEMFVQLCVLAGCDYCPSISGVGIVTAYKFVDSYKTPMKVLKELMKEKGNAVPDGYRDSFLSAILTFRHHLIFDPRDAKLKMLNPLSLSEAILPLVDKQLLFLGNLELGSDTITSIARGEIHPATHESYAWKDAGAALALSKQQEQQQQQQLLAVPVDRTTARSLTSSEASSVAPSDVDVRECDSVSRCESRISQDGTVPTDRFQQTDSPQLSDHQVPPRHSRVLNETPRPSSSSSWAHLDSLLGSSAHILNFRSPKVSDNFKPLSSLKAPARPELAPPGMLAHEVKEFENKPMRASSTRIRNPVNRRRSERGSGFEGEVICRVDTSRPSHSVLDDHDSAAGGDGDVDTDTGYFVLPAAKKPKLQDEQSAVDDADFISPCRQPRLIRPTPFGCQSVGTRDAAPSSLGLSAPSFSLRLPKFSLPLARSTFVEAKWDRILEREMENASPNGSSAASGSDVERGAIGHARALSPGSDRDEDAADSDSSESRRSSALSS